MNPRTRLKVLVVEDHAPDVRLVERSLAAFEAARIELLAVPRLEEACAAIAEHGRFDVILLDLNLPDSEGFATLRAIVEADGDTPIVVLTSLADEALAVEAVRLGAQDYVVKGVEPKALVRAVRYAILRQETVLAERARAEALAAEAVALRKLPDAAADDAARALRGREEFASLVLAFQEAVDRSLRERIYKVEPEASARVEAIVERIALYDPHPQDLIDLYLAALPDSSQPGGEATAEWVAEARLRLVELLAAMMLRYRRRVVLRPGPRLSTGGG